MKIKIGCCGFPVKMEEYFSKFSLVEIQKTFYRLPAVRIAKKWRAIAPENFEFCIKASQLITHPATSPTYKKAGIAIKEKQNYGFFRPTNEVFDAWEKTREICEVLRVEVVLFQCPASFKPTDESIKNMREFFRYAKGGMKFAWEPRGEGWTDEIVAHLCKEYNLIHAVDPFIRKPVSGGDAYFRLHGLPAYNYKYKYTDADLKQLKTILEKSDAVTSYVLFNNVSMIHDAQRFLKKLEMM